MIRAIEMQCIALINQPGVNRPWRKHIGIRKICKTAARKASGRAVRAFTFVVGNNDVFRDSRLRLNRVIDDEKGEKFK